MNRRLTAVVATFVVAASSLIASVPARAAGAVTATASGRWSDPATWGGGLPKAGDEVTIPSGTTVVLDASSPALDGLYVDGTLRFARKNVDLTSAWIMVHGRLSAGSPHNPFKHHARITLTGADQDASVMGMGNRVIGVMGGTLALHGAKTVPWTRLGATVRPGDRALTLERRVPWKPGDRIVVASTSYWGKHYDEATVTRVSGSTIEVDEPFEWLHWGETQQIAGRTLDQRAEVAVLSRNIQIRGSGPGLAEGFGAQVMFMNGGVAHLSGVEFFDVGQKGRMGRYPIHWHMQGDSTGSYVKRSVVRDSFNRCITMHGSGGVRLHNNVCLDHIGHGIFMEDGIETDNVLTKNLVLGTRSTDSGLLPSDKRATSYWITHPDNILRGNVAAGSDGVGFWLAFPEHPTGLSTENGKNVWPRRTPLGAFVDNVAHSNGGDGLHVDSGPKPDGNTQATWYRPVVDPTDEDSAPVTAVFENFTGYYNRNRGVWLRGENHVVTGAVLADNRSGATFASDLTTLEDSFVVGESDNPGTTYSWEDKGPGGQALPFFWDPDAQVIGFEFYDGKVGVTGTTFANFRGNAVRPAGALGYLAPNAFAIHPRNFAGGLTFHEATPVYLAPPVAGKDGDNSKVFVDTDGSVTGTAGRSVVIDNDFLLDDSCSFRSEWNAHVCATDYVSLMVGATDGDPAYVKPVVLTRGDGRTQSLMGCCDDSDDAWTTVMPGRRYQVAFNGGTPDRSRFVLWRGKGQWIELSLPMASVAKVTRWGWPLKQVDRLGALESAGDSAYFYDAAAQMLHVRLLGKGDWEEVRVQRT